MDRQRTSEHLCSIHAEVIGERQRQASSVKVKVYRTGDQTSCKVLPEIGKIGKPVCFLSPAGVKGGAIERNVGKRKQHHWDSDESAVWRVYIITFAPALSEQNR